MVSVGRYSAWESTATLRLLGAVGGARGAWAPTWGRGAGSYYVATRPACSAMHRIPLSPIFTGNSYHYKICSIKLPQKVEFLIFIQPSCHIQYMVKWNAIASIIQYKISFISKFRERFEGNNAVSKTTAKTYDVDYF